MQKLAPLSRADQTLQFGVNSLQEKIHYKGLSAGEVKIEVGGENEYR